MCAVVVNTESVFAGWQFLASRAPVVPHVVVARLYTHCRHDRTLAASQSIAVCSQRWNGNGAHNCPSCTEGEGNRGRPLGIRMLSLAQIRTASEACRCLLSKPRHAIADVQKPVQKYKCTKRGEKGGVNRMHFCSFYLPFFLSRWLRRAARLLFLIAEFRWFHSIEAGCRLYLKESPRGGVNPRPRWILLSTIVSNR